MNLKDTYNKIAEDWFKDHREDTWWIECTDVFASLLKPGNLILDVGCGAGIKTKYFINKGFNAVGVDFSEKMVEIAKREVPKATFQVADIKDLSGVKEQFDGVVAHAVLLHVPKTEASMVIQGLKDKLKNGGYLYIAVKEQSGSGQGEEVVAEEDYGYRYERFFSYYTIAEVKQYLVENKLQLCYEKTIQTGKTHWIQIICQK